MEGTNFMVEYTNKDIMEKLEKIHMLTSKTNGKVKLHTKLIFGAYGFTMALLVVGLSIILL